MVDSINPRPVRAGLPAHHDDRCRSRRRILLVGGAYIAAMFLFLLLVGIGLFSVFSLSGFSKMFSLSGGSRSSAGIITKPTCSGTRRHLSCPSLIQERTAGELYPHRVTSRSIYAGILAGILGFTCTEGSTSATGSHGRQMTVMSGFPWLSCTTCLCPPLNPDHLIVAYGISPERADRMRSEYKRAIRVIFGVILVALGAVILLGWLG